MVLSRRSVLASVLGAPVLLAARRARAQDPRRILRAVPVAPLRVLDPAWSAAPVTRNHGYLVFDTLFALDGANTPRPQMVEAWEADGGGLEWTFRLREGLLWHDGTPVRAADCVASLRRWSATDGMGRALAAVTDAMEARDERSFTLRLARRAGFVLDALARIDGPVPFMMPERLAAMDPGTPLTEMVGSGPFRFIAEDWEPGISAAYEKFAGYVPRSEPPSQAAGGKVAKLDRVELVATTDAAAGLIGGELDILEATTATLLERLPQGRDIVVAPNDPLGQQLFVTMNHLQPPFDRLEARRALMSAVRQSAIMEAVIGERRPWRECAAVFGCAPEDGVQSESLGWPAADTEAARRMLRDAGYDGRALVLLDPVQNATLHAATAQVAEALQRLGATVEAQAVATDDLPRRRAARGPPGEGGWNLFVASAAVAGIGNPLADIHARHCEEAWFGWPCDRRVGELTAAWAAEADTAKRREILKQLERLHLEIVTLIPLGQYRNQIAYRRSVRGILPGPAVFYWNIEKS